MVPRITVEEHAELQQRVWLFLDAGNHAARRESCLLHVGVEILRILVQHQSANLVH